jgi:transposase
VTTIGAERPDTEVAVILGVDTHLDAHVAVALDSLGRRLGELAVPTTRKGYESLVSWAEGFGSVRCAGVEVTSSYGAGLARHLKSVGIGVFEIERSKRRHLRRKGKSDSGMPRPPRERCWQRKPPASQRARTASWK